jgi:hypothetical protein
LEEGKGIEGYFNFNGEKGFFAITPLIFGIMRFFKRLTISNVNTNLEYQLVLFVGMLRKP